MTNLFNFSVQDDGLAFLSLQNSPVNALSSELISQLTQQFQLIEKNESIHCLIISSQLKHFCAGADLKERSTMNDEQTIEIVNKIGNCFNLLENLPFPTISAINGSALGGGLEMSLCCDFRVIEQSATLGLIETSLGIIPGAGGTQRLPRLIGHSKAKYWIYSARKFTAEEAFLDGVADFISEDEETLETAIDLAEELMCNSKTSLRAAKQAINKGSNKNLLDGLTDEHIAYKSTLTSVDRLEILKKYKKNNN